LAFGSLFGCLGKLFASKTDDHRIAMVYATH